MMTFIESQMQALIGQTFTANKKSFVVKQADNFAYTDPVDGSISEKQVSIQMNPEVLNYVLS